MKNRRLWTLAAAIAAAGIMTATAAPRQSASLEPKVDQVFARWNQTTPGCAVGVSVDGKSVLEKGYGMADLEHDTANRADTIFEAGSVSKQFTAAAVLLLVKDGKLSLDDPVRKYMPELPDYGAPLTIRHMLNHSSGLRDWGSVAGIGGWPRTTRVYTHAHVLDILSRQRALNFPSGHALLVQQQRLQPCGDHRVASERGVVCRVQPHAHLRAAEHDAHVLARRLHPRRQGTRDRVLGRRWQSSA